MGDDARAAAIRFIEPASGEVVALRPDITPQIARIAATRLSGIGGPARLSYEGAVARIGNGARGQREVLQAGIELIDAGGPLADAELLALAAAAVSTSQVGEQSLDLGHVALARHALSGIDDPVLRTRLEACLRRKDRVGVAKAAEGLAKSQRALLEALPVLFGDPDKTFERARKLALPAGVRKELRELEESIEVARNMAGQGAELLDALTLDLGELRGFEYYTGMRVSAFVRGAGGPVLRGGRYNRLVERYGRVACATGFAVDVEALAEAESSAGQEASHSTAGVLLVADLSHRKLAARVANSLRSEGLRVALDFSKKRSAKKQQAYASQVELPIVLNLGEQGFTVCEGRGAARPIPQTHVLRAARSDASALIQSLNPIPPNTRSEGKKKQ